MRHERVRLLQNKASLLQNIRILCKPNIRRKAGTNQMSESACGKHKNVSVTNSVTSLIKLRLSEVCGSIGDEYKGQSLLVPNCTASVPRRQWLSNNPLLMVHIHDKSVTRTIKGKVIY
jgi:hypothetical protein